MTLYLKYRPKNLDELDLPEVSESLKKIVESGKIPHAFLFSGPKGTGKTSAARILAKIIDCESTSLKLRGPGLVLPCEECNQCRSITKGNNLDVIEMDAASHRGIDDVRFLRDAVKLAPSKARKKIYIIDEAHMLTTEASNALLKTLEEPPDHVIFILATTNPEKLIDTIRSRVTNILFRKASIPEIVKSLKRVVTGEKIEIEEDSLSLIAEAAGGAFRDAIKILEQLTAEGQNLSKESLGEYLFKNKAFDIDRFVEFLAKRDIKNLLIEIGKLGPSGVTVELFVESLLKKLQSSLLASVGVGDGKDVSINKEGLLTAIELFGKASSDISSSPIEELPLEVAVIKWCGDNENIGGRSSNAGEGETKKIDTSEENLMNKNSSISDTKLTESQDSAFDIQNSNVNDDAWKMILSLVKPINASVEALLRASKPITYDGKSLTLGVFYKFHKERLEDATHRRIVEEAVGKVLNSPTKVICTIVDPPPKKVIEETKIETVLTEGTDHDIIKAAEEIFGN